eukprot:2488040-Rhodomonas_salina.1
MHTTDARSLKQETVLARFTSFREEAGHPHRQHSAGMFFLELLTESCAAVKKELNAHVIHDVVDNDKQVLSGAMARYFMNCHSLLASVPPRLIQLFQELRVFEMFCHDSTSSLAACETNHAAGQLEAVKRLMDSCLGEAADRRLGDSRPAVRRSPGLHVA